MLANEFARHKIFPLSHTAAVQRANQVVAHSWYVLSREACRWGHPIETIIWQITSPTRISAYYSRNYPAIDSLNTIKHLRMETGKPSNYQTGLRETPYDDRTARQRKTLLGAFERCSSPHSSFVPPATRSFVIHRYNSRRRRRLSSGWYRFSNMAIWRRV